MLWYALGRSTAGGITTKEGVRSTGQEAQGDVGGEVQDEGCPLISILILEVDFTYIHRSTHNTQQTMTLLLNRAAFRSIRGPLGKASKTARIALWNTSTRRGLLTMSRADGSKEVGFPC